MSKPKLILLYGFAGIGKTTLADHYVNEHPLAMNLEGDRLIVTLGQWLSHEDDARELVFELSKAMTATHLRAGYDVIIPYLLTNPKHAKGFEAISSETGAEFREVELVAERQHSIDRLMKRGTWGEEGTDPIASADLPVIEKLYDDMTKALEERNVKNKIIVVENAHKDTYLSVLEAINHSSWKL